MPAPSKSVLITGCSTGIGRATAERLAARGHTVYATARSTESLTDLEAKGCRTLALDVTDEASMRDAVNRVVAEEGAVGALVNNAGYSQSGALETLGMDEVRRQFETNVFGLLRMCQLCLPGMRDQGWGRIVNISSMGANFVFPGGGIYHATKYAVDAMSDALRFEAKGFGVDVVIVRGGPRVGGEGRRDRDHHGQAEDPLPRDRLGEGPSRPAPDDDRPDVGHVSPRAVPAARPAGLSGYSEIPSSWSSRSLRWSPPV